MKLDFADHDHVAGEVVQTGFRNQGWRKWRYKIILVRIHMQSNENNENQHEDPDWQEDKQHDTDHDHADDTWRWWWWWYTMIKHQEENHDVNWETLIMTHDMNIYIYICICINETNVDNGSTKPYDSWVIPNSLSPPNAEWADHGRASLQHTPRAHPLGNPLSQLWGRNPGLNRLLVKVYIGVCSSSVCWNNLRLVDLSVSIVRYLLLRGTDVQLM